MKTLHYIHSGASYLPELAAYAAFVQHLGHQVQVHTHPDSVPQDAAIVWWICGRVPRNAPQRWPHAFQVHEYASASVPPAAWCKDQLKRLLQPRPQYRLFQNAWVQQRLGFHDGVPSEWRDMGVAEMFLSPTARAPAAAAEFDAVYLGDMQRLQHFVPLFAALQRCQRRVLLVGELPSRVAAALQPYRSAWSVTGRLPQADVPAQLRRARCALNLVPNHAPYHQQTSTKLLEYCAVGLPVVSTDYAWARDFAQRQGARFAWLPQRCNLAAGMALFGTGWEATLAACSPPPAQSMQALAWPRLLERLALWQVLGLRA